MRAIALLLLVSCAHAFPAGAPPPAPAENAQPVVVTGTIDTVANDVEALVHAVRARTAAARGRVMNESVSGGVTPHATMRLRLPPPAVAAFADWLATISQVRDRHLDAVDVSRAYVDQELALHNLRTTMARLEAIAERGGSLADVLEVEKELTRVRGEIERLEGERRQLADAVALATVDLTIVPADEALAPHALFQLVPSASLLTFVDGRGRGARPGGGVGLMFARSGALELQIFPAIGAQPRAGLFTLHVGATSDFFGGGRRRWCNPYLGLLAGGGSVGGHGVFTAGTEAGLELYRGPRLFLAAEARAQILLYHEGVAPTDVALQAVVSAGVPF